MKIVIAGGTGFIGSYLYQKLTEEGNEVVLISRKTGHIQWNVQKIKTAIKGSDVLINLSGRSINCRHNTENKKEILSSRISTTRMLSEAVTKCTLPPKVWINSSATAMYEYKVGNVSTEKTFVKAISFLSDVVEKWESEFFLRNDKRTRKVALRTAVVLGKNGGALYKLLQLTRLGLGGKAGNGHQMFSWIHVDDYFRIIKFIINNDNLSGIINCSSPHAVTNNQLMHELRKNVGVRIGIPSPAFGIKIGAMLLNTEADLILGSSNVYPEVLLNAGYEFEYPTISSALYQLVKS
jgi:uncharacterized protein